MVALTLSLTACGGGDALAPATTTTPPAALPSRFYPPEGWTWGLLQVGDAPPVRYGVGAPRRAHRGEIVIVPAASEPAEAWFETANELIAQEWGVWVLDLHGQGGSARSGTPRDMVSVDSFEPDADALRTLVRDVVRPSPARRVVVLASGEGAAVALMSLSQEEGGVSGAVLSAPTLVISSAALSRPQDDMGESGRWMRRIGLGDGFALGEREWSSTAATASGDPLRVRAGAEWMRANPELRTGGVSWSWFAAWADLSEQVRQPERLRRIGVPIQIIAATRDGRSAPGSAEQACRALPHCSLLRFDGTAPPHLAADPERARWLEAVLAFAEARR